MAFDPPVLPARAAFGSCLLLQHPQANGHLTLQGEPVHYLLRRARRRSVGMRITEEGLVVTAPTWLALSELERILQIKGAWIVRKLHEQHTNHSGRNRLALQWQDGMLLPYLGAQLLVRLTGSSGIRLTRKVPAASLSTTQPQLLQVPLPPDADAVMMARAVEAWFFAQALEHYAQRIAHFSPLLGVHCRELRLSGARTRWGSATARGTIRLHWGLLHFAPEIIDYVVVHELCHLREMNHSPRFWQLVESLLPQQAALRRELKALRLPDWSMQA